MVSKKIKPNPGDPEKTVLLIIDVQRGLFAQSTPIYNEDRLIGNILDLADRAHQAGAPVVYIQHCGEESLIKGTEDWQLHPRLDPQPGDWSVFKEHGNAFEDTNLRELLVSRHIGRVVACGLVTHGCVKNTCLGGLAEGYPIVLASDAHSNYSKDAPKIIEKWNKQLTEKGVIVLRTADIDF